MIGVAKLSSEATSIGFVGAMEAEAAPNSNITSASCEASIVSLTRGGMVQEYLAKPDHVSPSPFSSASAPDAEAFRKIDVCRKILLGA